MQAIKLQWIDYTILIAYVAFVIGIGLVEGSEPVSLGININLIWGAVLLVLGVLMLVGAIKGGHKNGK